MLAERLALAPFSWYPHRAKRSYCTAFLAVRTVDFRWQALSATGTGTSMGPLVPGGRLETEPYSNCGVLQKLFCTALASCLMVRSPTAPCCETMQETCMAPPSPVATGPEQFSSSTRRAPRRCCTPFVHAP